jgi:hypothetical protein
MGGENNVDQNRKDKLKALEMTLGNIEKQYGKGTIMKLGDQPAENIPFIPTGSIGLDAALGIGGLPRGLRYMAPSQAARRLWHCMLLQKLKSWAELRHLLMQSMHSTVFMHKNWASISITC